LGFARGTPSPWHFRFDILQRRESEVMYERFTDRARKVMQLANREAQRLRHEYIGTEHILLGLVKEGAGIAANVLKNLDIDLRKVRLEVERIVQSGPDTVTTGKLPQTPRAKKVIEYTMEEARNLNHNYVGTEHILLGLLREEEGVAAQVLMNLGLKLADVRGEVLSLLGHGLKGSAATERGLGLHESVGERGTSETNSLPEAAVRHYLYPRFTDRARKAIQLAYQEAQRLGHEYIGTEHILLGLIKLDSGIAADLLKRHNIDLPSLQLYVDRLIGTGSGSEFEDALPHPPRAKNVIGFAIEESRSLGDAYFGTEHLLLGLLREDCGLAAQALFNHGLELRAVREEVQSLGRSRDMR
jgi:ATP-dependent Clp protease ATP-binding subunit ClpC